MARRKTDRTDLKIEGMHCASCEVLIERELMKASGVRKVMVNHTSGRARVDHSTALDLKELNKAIAENGYSIAPWHDEPEKATHSRKREAIETGAMFLLLFGAYLLLNRFDALPKGLSISEDMSFGFVVLVGLVAAVSSCIAVTGGLLLAVVARYNEKFSAGEGIQKLKPHLHFNIGRIVSYTAFGGIIGAVGSAMAVSPKASGLMTLTASAVMIILGLQILGAFPRLMRFQPRMPKFLAHRIHAISERGSASAPFLLGVGTFFLPCGFTQALQIYVLSRGGAMEGALTMLAFSLGTLPALLSLGLMTSFIRGSLKRYFLKFAGVLVVMIGLFNIDNGLVLAGVHMPQRGGPPEMAQGGDYGVSPNVSIVDGVQLVEMAVVGYEYVPNRFTVLEGVPVEWRIDARSAAGCGRVIMVPTLGITDYLEPREANVIRFTPEKEGVIAFNCSMWMMTPGSAFDVVPNDYGVIAGTSSEGQDSGTAECDPGIMDCELAQRIVLRITEKDGFQPDILKVKVGRPVELVIDAEIVPGGCSSTLLIPDLDIVHLITLGESIVKFTPKEVGILQLTCAMGSPHTSVYVLN